MSKYMLLAFLVVILAIVIVEIEGRRRTKVKVKVKVVIRKTKKIKRSVGPELEQRYLPCDFDCLDKNKDGSVTLQELENALQKRVPSSVLEESVKLVFANIDINSDELLIQDEFDKYYNEKDHCILDDLAIQTIRQ